MYTRDDSIKIQKNILSRYSGSSLDDIRLYTIRSILSELNENRNLELSNVNLLIDTLNSNGFTFSHYSSVSELDTMFENVYSSGESSLGTRDRILLRLFASPGIDIIVDGSFPSFTYTSDGVPDFTSTIISDSGKSTKDMLKYCFEILNTLFSGNRAVGNPWTPEMIDYLNSMIPDKYAPKFDRTNNMSISNAIQTSTPDAKTIWLKKALLIGPAYIAWLAENKWHLDLNWTP